MTPKCGARRGVLGRVAVGLGAVLEAACAPQGAAPGGGEEAPGGAQGPQGKLVFYTRGGVVETRGQAEILIPTFRDVAPRVTVEHVVFAAAGPDETYGTKLYAMWSAGEPPDVWGFGGNYFTYWARGMCADLLPYVTRDRYDLGQFHKGLPEMFRIRGKQYGLPQLTTFGTLLFYNKQLFAAAGLAPPPTDWEDKAWTLDAAVDAARKLTKDPGEPTAVYGLNFGPWMPHAGAWLFGGDAFLPEHYKDSIAPATRLDSPESVAVHELAQDLRWKQRYHARPGDPAVAQPGRNAFQSGRLAMDINGGWNFWSNSVIQDFPWGAAALPRKVSTKNPNYNDFWIMARASKQADLTWTFLKHLTSAEVQAKYSDLTGTPPTNRGAIDTWYRKYERIMPRAEIERVTQGAIAPQRSIESPDHTFLDFARFDQYYYREVHDPISRNEGAPREIIARAKPGYDALAREIYDQWQGKLPA